MAVGVAGCLCKGHDCSVTCACCCCCLQDNPLECESKSSSSPIITSSRGMFGRSNSIVQEDSTVQVRGASSAAQQLWFELLVA